MKTDGGEARREWDLYWTRKKSGAALYDLAAEFYRKYLIRPRLARYVRRCYPPGSRLLHAGCGGGEVDDDVVAHARVTAMDISPRALERYRSRHGDRAETALGDLMDLTLPAESFDGVYNLGVMEHFQVPEVQRILGEMARLLKPGGTLLLFWPPSYGLSVIFLHGVHFVLNRVLRRNVKLHPDEPTKATTARRMRAWLEDAGLRLEEFSFNASDAFTYVVVVARKPAQGS